MNSLALHPIINSKKNTKKQVYCLFNRNCLNISGHFSGCLPARILKNVFPSSDLRQLQVKHRTHALFNPSIHVAHDGRCQRCGLVTIYNNFQPVFPVFQDQLDVFK